jgi:hypothetical protein
MKRRTLLSLTAALLALSSMASAHQQVKLDPDDSDGPLDIVVAEVRHSAGEYKFRVVTYEKWRTKKLVGPRSFITFEVRRDSQAEGEICIVIDAVVVHGKYRPTGRVYRNAAGCNYFDDQFVAEVEARRMNNRHDAAVTVPTVALPWAASGFKWRAVSAFERDDHPVCPTPEPHGDGGYGTCTDKTKRRTHTDN